VAPTSSVLIAKWVGRELIAPSLQSRARWCWANPGHTALRTDAFLSLNRCTRRSTPPAGQEFAEKLDETGNPGHAGIEPYGEGARIDGGRPEAASATADSAEALGLPTSQTLDLRGFDKEHT